MLTASHSSPLTRIKLKALLEYLILINLRATLFVMIITHFAQVIPQQKIGIGFRLGVNEPVLTDVILITKLYNLASL